MLAEALLQVATFSQGVGAEVFSGVASTEEELTKAIDCEKAHRTMVGKLEGRRVLEHKRAAYVYIYVYTHIYICMCHAEKRS